MTIFCVFPWTTTFSGPKIILFLGLQHPACQPLDLLLLINIFQDTEESRDSSAGGKKEWLCLELDSLFNEM